jgi:hypothetical protein
MNQFPNWQQCLPMYEKELAIFRRRIAQLGAGVTIDESKPAEPLPQIEFTLKPGAGEAFTVERGANLFPRSNVTITDLAPELSGMKGIRIVPNDGGTLHFDLAQPAQILVGFAGNGSKQSSLLDPETEQWNLLLLNAISAAKISSIAVWAKQLPTGENELDLGKGEYVVLGFIPADLHVTPHVNFAQTGAGSAQPNLDWLFE